ncbi:hypothetical protein V8C37DRAFT_174384 [Trichoderma ceciliae]
MGEPDFDIDFYGDADVDANDQPRQEERRHSGGRARDDYDYRGRDHRQRDDEHEDDRRYESSRSEDAEDSSHQHGVKRKSEEQEPNDRPIDSGATAAIMISELSWWITDDDIRGWLRNANCEKEVKELTFSEHKVNGKSKGQAYVELQTRQAATAAKRYIDSVSADSVQPGQKKITTSYWNPGVNPFRTLPKDAPARVKEQPRAAPSGSYNDRGNYGGFRGRGGMGGNRGGMNPNFNRNYNGGMGYNSNNMGGGGGYNGPMGGVASGGGTHYIFSGRSSPGGNMRGVQTIIRGRGGGGGGGGGGGMMGMNPMGGMGMGMPGNMGMGMMGNGMPGTQATITSHTPNPQTPPHQTASATGKEPSPTPPPATPSPVFSEDVVMVGKEPERQPLEEVQQKEHEEEGGEVKEEIKEEKLDDDEKEEEEEEDSDDDDDDDDDHEEEEEEEEDISQEEPLEQNPQVKEKSSGQVANASATTSSAAQPRQYYQNHDPGAENAQTSRGSWGCGIHGILGPRCIVCDVEYWRHYHFFVSGYRYHGRVPPPPFPIFPMPLHQPSLSSSRFPHHGHGTLLTCV